VAAGGELTVLLAGADEGGWLAGAVSLLLVAADGFAEVEQATRTAVAVANTASRPRGPIGRENWRRGRSVTTYPRFRTLRRRSVVVLTRSHHDHCPRRAPTRSVALRRVRVRLTRVAPKLGHDTASASSRRCCARPPPVDCARAFLREDLDRPHAQASVRLAGAED